MKLQYFPYHGRAIYLRMLLHYCNQDFEDEQIQPAEWKVRQESGE